MKKTPRVRAFTLIELLVVIAIIALLVAILLPPLRPDELPAKHGAGSATVARMAASIEPPAGRSPCERGHYNIAVVYRDGRALLGVEATLTNSSCQPLEIDRGSGRILSAYRIWGPGTHVAVTCYGKEVCSAAVEVDGDGGYLVVLPFDNRPALTKAVNNVSRAAKTEAPEGGVGWLESLGRAFVGFGLHIAFHYWAEAVWVLVVAYVAWLLRRMRSRAPATRRRGVSANRRSQRGGRRARAVAARVRTRRAAARG